MNADLPALRSFVLPGGTEMNAPLHVCRTVCRRAERLCVRLAREEPAPEYAVSISEPAERRFLRLEPVGERAAWSCRSALETE